MTSPNTPVDVEADLALIERLKAWCAWYADEPGASDPSIAFTDEACSITLLQAANTLEALSIRLADAVEARDEALATEAGWASRALKAEAERREMLEALKACRLELYWCAEQLAARGVTGHPGDSVSRAIAGAGAILSASSEGKGE